MFIYGVEEFFFWGVWVLLSEKSFNCYVEIYDDLVEGDGFFGWVCNEILVYFLDWFWFVDVCV